MKPVLQPPLVGSILGIQTDVILFNIPISCRNMFQLTRHGQKNTFRRRVSMFQKEKVLDNRILKGGVVIPIIFPNAP